MWENISNTLISLPWIQILEATGIVLEGIGLYYLIALTPGSFEKYYHDYIHKTGGTIKGKFERDQNELRKTQYPIAFGLLFQLLAVLIS